MSEETWKKLSIAGLILAALDVITLIIFFDKPYYALRTPMGKILFSILGICFVFGVFDRVRDQITKGVNGKTFLYTAVIIGAMYLFATYVVV
ncbi:hypothetical protein [Virgibacillus siamensis]|uniref:hypothetical protein n=1 Tax=Virgibacillus siamensis TaxID=480071 RepID=UPI0009862AB4|nr:hypothetical protein [Virgibacillus siamensis]